jgi:hypothetical protein
MPVVELEPALYPDDLFADHARLNVDGREWYVECEDIRTIAYAVTKPDGTSRMERREPPYRCDVCGGEMVVEDLEEEEEEAGH